MSGFEDLRIYQLSLEGVKQIYILTRKYPLSKDFSMIDQIRRASCSVSANIAEGYGRNTIKDRSQFLTYSIGSSNEVIAFLDIISNIYSSMDTTSVREFYISLGRQIYSFRKIISKN